jgi:hypothetical protein
MTGVLENTVVRCAIRREVGYMKKGGTKVTETPLDLQMFTII